MSLLQSPEAEALLNDALLLPENIRECGRHLEAFLARYLPRFYRVEHRKHATTYLEGLLSPLERKTCLPIAILKEKDEKPLQYFVGLGQWDDEAVMAELRSQVREACGHPDGVLILDPSAFPKQGKDSCGVKRQWCGRLGKVENCQLGVFLAYSSPRGRGPLDRRLFLPEEWAEDQKRREKTHVPAETVFRAPWELGMDLLSARRGEIPHGWIAGDAEFGRCTKFREHLRTWGERYVLDAPCNTLVRDLERQRPRRRKAGRGRRREVPFVRAEVWAAAQAPPRWERFKVSDGEKGPIKVDAMRVRVRTRADGRVGPLEWLLVTRTVDEKRELSYALSNAGRAVSLRELVRVKAQRHQIEELFQAAKGEVGLDEYEVRGWNGWHHHITLSLLALWFLTLERRRLGGKNPRNHGPANPSGLLAVAL